MGEQAAGGADEKSGEVDGTGPVAADQVRERKRLVTLPCLKSLHHLDRSLEDVYIVSDHSGS